MQDGVICAGLEGVLHPIPWGVREGFLEEEASDRRFEGTGGVHQAKTKKRFLGRGDREVQGLESD